MKKRFNRIFTITTSLLLIIFIYFSACAPAKSTTKSSTTAKGSDTSKWVFRPRQAMPEYGSTQVLSATYFVRYQSGRLIVALPYYGKSYGGADVLSGRSPLDFTSTDFTTSSRDIKNGKELVITPKDHPQVRTMTFSFYDNGNANLGVIMASSSGINYIGAMD